MVRVKMALARTNHVCLCDFLFVFGSCLFSDPFFGHEVWPNYTGLQCLVSNACDGKHVYIVFFILYFYIFLLVLKKEVNSLFIVAGLIGFENGPMS